MQVALPETTTFPTLTLGGGAPPDVLEQADEVGVGGAADGPAWGAVQPPVGARGGLADPILDRFGQPGGHEKSHFRMLRVRR